MPVGIEIGRAIILAGGENTLTNWDVTKKVSVSVYRYLKGMGFRSFMADIFCQNHNFVNARDNQMG
jgi:hypothetical protein